MSESVVLLIVVTIAVVCFIDFSVVNIYREDAVRFMANFVAFNFMILANILVIVVFSIAVYGLITGE